MLTLNSLLYNSDELFSMIVLPSLQNTYKGAYGISSDYQCSPSKASNSGPFDPRLNNFNHSAPCIDP